MKKKVFGRKLGRDTSSRRALFRSLIRAFVAYGKISTTKAKAKAVQPDIEKLVSLAKSKDISVIRRVYSYLANDRVTTDKLFNSVAPVFTNKKSGFTRIINLPRRLGDNAEMASLEWTEKVGVGSEKLVVSKKTKKNRDLKVIEAKVTKEKSGIKSKVAGLLKSRKK